MHLPRGFTLVELLVVITIIGILSSVVFVSFGNSQAQARDNERKATLAQMQLAIERYRADNGQYPEGGCGMHQGGNNYAWVAPGNFTTGAGYDDGTSGTLSNCTNYIEGLVPEYIDMLPVDRTFSTTDDHGYRYAVNRDRSAFKLIAHYAIESDQTFSNLGDMARCSSICTDTSLPGWCAQSGQMGGDPDWTQEPSLAVYSPGAECW